MFYSERSPEQRGDIVGFNSALSPPRCVAKYIGAIYCPKAE